MIPGLHKALGAFFIDSCDWVVVGLILVVLLTVLQLLWSVSASEK